MAEASFTTNPARSKPESSASASAWRIPRSLDTYLANDGFKAFRKARR